MIAPKTDATWDAVVLGAGPGGCSCAIKLAQQGRRVLVIEKESFPRFRIGESLLPFGNDSLKELGVYDRIANGPFIRKYGAEFTIGNGAGHIKNWFRNNQSPQHDHAFQVERAKFDQILLDRAVECGAEVLQPAKATRIDAGTDNEMPYVVVTGIGGERQIHTRFLIDATGRTSLLARQLKLKTEDLPLIKRVALYAHFSGVHRPQAERAGNIVLTRLERAWFWFIPINETTTSVGLVVGTREFQESGQEPEEFFLNTVNAHADPTFRMKEATRIGDVHVTTDYTTRYQNNAGPRWLLAGDAAGFIDPVFSSGVHLALASGIKAGKLVDEALASDRALTRNEQKNYTRTLHRNGNRFLPLIKAYYDDPSFEIFMNPVSRWNLARCINRLLSGDLSPDWSDHIRFTLFKALCWLQRFIHLAPPLSLK